MSAPEHVRPPRRHLLVQAEVPPLDEDGVVAFAAGTVVFAVLTALALAQRDALRAQGHEWWAWAAAIGLAVGLLACGYCLWRRRGR